MTLSIPRSPSLVHRLIAEAKRRARQRRTFALVALLCTVGVAITTLSLQPFGGSGGATGGSGALSPQALARLAVPVGSAELGWRHEIIAHRSATAAGSDAFPGIRRNLLMHVRASGASVVRMKIWQTTAISPAVELVVATSTPPGLYVQRYLDT